MRATKQIKAICLSLVIASGVSGAAIYHYYTGSKRELERQIRAMDGMSINLSIAGAEALYEGADSTYVPA